LFLTDFNCKTPVSKILSNKTPKTILIKENLLKFALAFDYES